MGNLTLHDFHAALQARFLEVNGQEAVADYGDLAAEAAALGKTAAVLDLSFRGRVCLLGNDRVRFLHGQVTNDVNRLRAGQGCYAALVTAKGKMVSDLNIYRLENELLLDFEPGLTPEVVQRLERYIIADDVQVMDVAPQYGLLSVQGPRAADVVSRIQPGIELPRNAMDFVVWGDSAQGESCLMNQARLGTRGYDLFVPSAGLTTMAEKLSSEAKAVGGIWCGWSSFEAARIEAGIPRFGLDMNESNLPPEAGLESRAISYSKGCYIGQEIIARIRTYGQVAKSLCGLRLSAGAALPRAGDKLYKDGKEAGYITSAVNSAELKATIALGYVRRGTNSAGTELVVRSEAGESAATVVTVPFVGRNAGAPS